MAMPIGLFLLGEELFAHGRIKARDFSATSSGQLTKIA